MGILTVGIVTRPFKNEGPHKAEKADKGIEDLKPHVDALLVISNERILQMFSNLRYREALSQADDILFTASKGIAEIITVEGYMNVDFRDVKTALENSGRAIMGTGIASGDDRAINAAQKALDSPLLDENSIEGSKHILVNISFGNDEPYTNEIDIITGFFQQQAGQNANLKFGLTYNDSLDKEIAITVVATGFENHEMETKAKAMNENSGMLEINLDTPSSIVLPIEDIKPTESPVQDEQLLFLELNKMRAQREIQSAPVENKFKNLNNMEIPAYLRHNVVFDEAEQGIEMSKLFLEEEKENKAARFKDGGNKYLHDNVD
jgi:cell division protein FtsZ